MVEYIRRIAAEIANTTSIRPATNLSYLLSGLTEELDRLDTRDFLPEARYDFVMLRKRARAWGTATEFYGDNLKDINRLGNEALAVLDKYGGEDSRAIVRSFSFITDTQLRAIIERDYRELTLNIFPSGAWKSTVILAGSILEAILFDLLTSDASRKSKALSSPKAPKANKRVKDFDGDEWNLHNLIEVSVDLGLLPDQRSKTFDQVLRDYRNFVHPRKEIRSQHPCTEAEALMAKGALDGVCNHLSGMP